MTSRWICARCYTSAEETQKNCPNCGTPRGLSKSFSTGPSESAADPTPAPPPAAGPPPAAAVPPPSEAPPPASSEPAAPTESFTETAAAAAVPGSAAAEAAGPASADESGERWVCRRCFASNDGWRTACTNCGLDRGAEPPADAPGEWAAAAGVPAETQGGRRFPWQWVLYGVIALAVVGTSVFFAARRSDSGEITDAGDLSVQDLRVGDCFDLTEEIDPEQGGEVSNVRAIPCGEPHVYEIYAVADYPSGEEPSALDEEYTDWELDQCVGGFEEYVGIPFNDSVYYFSTLTPTEESWNQGDRSISCFLHNLEETAVTGSAQGAAE